MLEMELDISMEDCGQLIGNIEMPIQTIEQGGSPTINSSCACTLSYCGSCKPPYCG